MPMRIALWHNILWSRYKGVVFTAVHRAALARGDQAHIVQAAETEVDRHALAAVDRSYHQYPYELLYPGALDAVPSWRVVPYFFWRGLSAREDFVVIAGYAEPRNWAQLIGLILSRTPRGVFCDSTLNESRPERWRGWAKRLFFQRCDIIFHYGERARAMALHFGARGDVLVRRRQAAALLPDYDARAVPAQRAAAVSRSGRFLYVGRFAEEKNLDRLIDAFARVHAQIPGATLRLVGDGPLRATLEAQVARLGLGEAVVFTGGLSPDRLTREYLAATAMVLPSLREPWGLVVNEALAHGCPVLVSDRCGCVPELVHSGRSGVAIDPLDVDAMAAALLATARDPAAIGTVEGCLEVIAAYTPEAAARDILDGIHGHFARSHAKG